MKLLRYGEPGRERPGLIDGSGTIRDLSGILLDITPETMSPAELERLAGVRPESLPIVKGEPRIGVPIAGIRKFLGIGLNYRDHAIEAGLDLPVEPILFTKAISCLNGPDDPVMLPPDSVKLDWEVELGVVIGTRARYVREDAALDYVAGYVLLNDVSERSYQNDRGGTIDKGKGCDTFGPIGPWLVSADEVDDPQNLAMWLNVNGERMQTGNTGSMIFCVARLIAYVSQFMTLDPGDVIATGTPAGVGLGRKPQPRFLKPGDIVTLGIDGLGTQRQHIVGFRDVDLASSS